MHCFRQVLAWFAICLGSPCLGAVDPWVDRAERDIRLAMRDESAIVEDLRILNDAVLGNHLYKLSKREGHVTLLKEIAGAMEKRASTEVDVVQKLGGYWGAADVWGTVGDRAEVARLFKTSATLLDQVEATGKLEVFSMDLTRSSHRQARACAGDLSAQEIAELSLQDLSMICRLLEASGDQARQQPFIDAARTHINAIKDDDTTSIRLLCDVYICTGQGDEAIAFAERAGVKDRVNVLLGVVRRFLDRGDKPRAAKSAVAAWRAATTPRDGDSSLDQSSALGWLVEAEGPKDVAATATATVSQRLEGLKGKRFSRERYAANVVVKASHYLGRPADRDKWLARLETLPPTEPQDRRGEAWIDLAALAAEVDRLDLSEKCLAAARKEKRTSYSWSMATAVVTAYAKRGDFDKAEKLLTEIDPERSRFDDVRMAKARVRHGQYDQAMQAAGRLEKMSDRLRVKHAIVVHRVQNGKLDGLAAWIDAEPSPRQRAALNLAVVEELSNKRLDAYSLLLRIPK